MNATEIKDKLLAVGLDIRSVWVDRGDSQIEVDGVLTYATLGKVAETLGTDRIDIAPESDGAGCGSCGYGAHGYFTLTVYGVGDA